MRDPKLKLRRRPQEDGHWLGEGMDGQDSLFFELDPYLYSADRELAQAIRSFYFRLRDSKVFNNGDKPKVLFCPPQDAVGFQLGLLSEFFSVSLLAEERDTIREEACAEFHAELLDTGVPPERHQAYDLILHTGCHFRDLDQLRAALRFARDALAFDGRAIFLLAGYVENGEGIIHWADNSTTACSALESGEVFLVKPPVECIIQPLIANAAQDSDYLGAFLKRHRDYFGRAARGLCLERLKEEEFQIKRSDEPAVMIVSWDQFNAETEKLY